MYKENLPKKDPCLENFGPKSNHMGDTCTLNMSFTEIFHKGVLSLRLVYLLRELLLNKIFLHANSYFCDINFVKSIVHHFHLLYFVICC